MPRPRRCRRVQFEPGTTYFKPKGVPLSDLEEVTLNVEELESLRLKDLEGKEQIESANIMNVSQPTFHRILLSARKKVAEALVKGKAIKIEGGNYDMPTKNRTELTEQRPFRRGRGMGNRMGLGNGRIKGRGN